MTSPIAYHCYSVVLIWCVADWVRWSWVQLRVSVDAVLHWVVAMTTASSASNHSQRTERCHNNSIGVQSESNSRSSLWQRHRQRPITVTEQIISQSSASHWPDRLARPCSTLIGC